MKVVYIIGKYTSKDERKKTINILRANIAGIKWAEHGYAVITPHTNFRLHEKEIGYKGVMKECYELIKRSDIIYVLSNYKTSKGSKLEIKLAEKLGKIIEWE